MSIGKVVDQTPQHKLADFFLQIRPEGNLHVASIPPDGGDPTGRTYAMPEGALDAASWLIERNNQMQNCYFTLNPVVDNPGNKPGKDQLSGFVALHADIDPDGEGGYDEQRSRLMNGRLDAVKQTKPSFIIDSGNGIVPIYLLEEPVGSEMREAVEQANYALLEDFNADPGTWNSDRLLRAPFTSNISGHKKTSKGYPVFSEAVLLWQFPENRIRLSDARKAPVPLASDKSTVTPIAPEDVEGLELRFMGDLKNVPSLSKRWDGDTDGLSDGSCSGTDRAIAQVMKRLGYSYDEFAHLVRHYDPAPANSRYREAKGSSDRYVSRKYEPNVALPPEEAQPTPQVFDSVEDLFSDLIVTHDDVKDIKEARMLYHSMIPEGHLVALVGAPGAGKTTVMEHVAAELVSEGLRVLYVNADIGAADIPLAKQMADEGRYSLLCPDVKEGMSMADVEKKLSDLANSDLPLVGYCFIIDTLKKLVSVIDKRAAASIFKLLRKLTSRGATVICLAHTNKYKDESGVHVYEGTGDLLADSDDVALLVAHHLNKHEQVTSLFWKEDGVDWCKSRATVSHQTWDINIPEERGQKRLVERRDDFLDTIKTAREAAVDFEVKDIREAVEQALRARPDGMNKGVLVNQVKDSLGVGQKRVANVVERFSGTVWHIEQQAGNNNRKIVRLGPDWPDEDWSK